MLAKRVPQQRGLKVEHGHHNDERFKNSCKKSSSATRIERLGEGDAEKHILTNLQKEFLSNED